MSSVFWKPGRKQWYARLKGVKKPGKWSDVPTGYPENQKTEAERFAREAQKRIDKKHGVVRDDVLTLRSWVAKWLKTREEAGHDWKKDRGRLDKHVLPILGGEELAEVTTAHIAALVHDLRFKSKLANRTVRNVYSVLAAVFRDARIAGHINQTPCILTDVQLGSVIDKDPEWRAGAQFARREVETMISDARIPADRQLVYALGLLAGLRPGEGAALRWRNYSDREPLGCLTIARAYSTSRSLVKGTKTEAVRYVPVHPVLAEMLAQWRSFGWEQMFGRKPEPDDLIIPLPPDVKRTKREGERFRGWDYTGRRWRELDAKIVGGHSRSVYDTRATFITLVLEDGADPDVIEQRVTHTKNRRSAFSGYDRGERWTETCREVAKLRIRRLADVLLTVQDLLIDSDTNGLRRRVSNDQSRPPELRVIQGGREDTWCSCHPEVASPSASLRTGHATALTS